MQKLLSTASSVQQLLPGKRPLGAAVRLVLALASSFVVAGLLFVVPAAGRDYVTLVCGLGWYIFWPFGNCALFAVIFRPKGAY